VSPDRLDVGGVGREVVGKVAEAEEGPGRRRSGRFPNANQLPLGLQDVMPPQD